MLPPIEVITLIALSFSGSSDWWADQPISRDEPPAVKADSWCRNDIDHFILARLEAEGLTPSPEADRRTLIRRATYNLTGLPPDPGSSRGICCK